LSAEVYPPLSGGVGFTANLSTSGGLGLAIKKLLQFKEDFDIIVALKGLLV